MNIDPPWTSPRRRQRCADPPIVGQSSVCTVYVVDVSLLLSIETETLLEMRFVTVPVRYMQMKY